MLDFISNPLREVLLTLVQITGSLGLAIIALTVALKLLLLPLTLPSLKAAEAMRLLQPEIEKLKRQFGKDKTGLQAAQLALFKEHKINPAAGCLPQIFQMGIFIVLYQVFMSLLQNQQEKHTLQKGDSVSLAHIYWESYDISWVPDVLRVRMCKLQD